MDIADSVFNHRGQRSRSSPDQLTYIVGTLALRFIYLAATNASEEKLFYVADIPFHDQQYSYDIGQVIRTGAVNQFFIHFASTVSSAVMCTSRAVIANGRQILLTETC